MIGISGYALASGDPLKLLTPFDSDGNRCGYPGQTATKTVTGFTEENPVRDFSEYNFKLFTNLDLLLNAELAPGVYDAVCVKECPNFSETPTTEVNGIPLAGIKTESM
jgi:hypothetical protein